MVTVADCAAAATFLAASSPVPPTTRAAPRNEPSPDEPSRLPTFTAPLTRFPPWTPWTFTGIANPSGTVTVASPPPVYASNAHRRDSLSSATSFPPAVSTAMAPSSPSPPATPPTVTSPPALRTTPMSLTCVCLSTRTAPPAVSTRRTPPNKAPTTKSPPIVFTSSVLPTSLPTRTLPPSVPMTASAVMVSARTSPPAVLTRRLAPRIDPNTTSPPDDSTATADSTTCATWQWPPPVVTSTPQKRGGTRHRRLPRPRGCMSACASLRPLASASVGVRVTMTPPSEVARASSAGGAGLAPSQDSAGFHEPSTVIASYSSPTTTSTSTGQRGGHPSGAQTRSVDPTPTSNRRRARSIGAVVITRRDAERVGTIAG
mmetsp:Transcript_11710/g.49125  ORF Transcript_11710/g.49125 Transcript_11710/m.49125 type:complete len:373 (-) Transcript_11710:80-1198(-)